MAMVTISGIRFAKEAYNIMEGLFRQNWAANKVQTFMSGIGMGYRRTSVQLVRRHVLDLVKKQGIVESMAADERPGKYALVEEAWESEYRYVTYGSQTFFDPDTGLEDTSPWQLYSNDLPTKESALAKLYEMHILGDSKEGTTIIHAEAIQFKHKKGATY